MAMLLLLLLLHLGQGLSGQAAPLSLLGADKPMLSLHNPTPLCTCPDHDERSVWDILWSCLVVAFACSWVSVHPDIPAPGEGWKRSTLRRVEYKLWTLLAPELMIYWAAKQYMAARRIAKEQHEHGWTTTHGHFLQMGGFMLFDGKKAKGVLPYTQFKKLLNKGHVKFPEITEEEIKDRGKSDGLSKTLVVAQTGWFILQCISRRKLGLDITKMELATLAFAALNGFMYFFWWKKPFDVHVSVPVRLLPAATLENSQAQVDKDLDSTAMFRSGFKPRDILNWPSNIVKFTARRMNAFLYQWPDDAKIFENHDIATSTEAAAILRVPIFYHTHDPIDNGVIDCSRLFLVMTFVASGFGAIHCAGWSFHFPSTAELCIWRISALSTTILPFTVYLCGLISRLIENNEESVRDFLNDILGFTLVCIMAPIYIAARVALLVEAFSTLRNLPPGALAVVKWTSFIPHIS